MVEKQQSGRAVEVVRAAVEVMGESGAAGLTHRAVDRRAGVPEGTTSNHFRTRAALVHAICRFLTDHDLVMFDRVSQSFATPGALTIDQATDGLVEIVENWTKAEALFTAARLELFLLARRDPEIALQMGEVRRTFRRRTTEWLDGMLEHADQHVLLVMALVEGLTANQLLHAESRLSRDEMRDELRQVLAALT